MLHNEPLVRLDGRERNLLSVSPKVNTKSYHDAFMKMPVPKPVAEAAYIQAGWILQKADGKDEEYLVAIDARTGTLIADNLGRKGHPRNTAFNGEELRALRAHSKDVITIHNHPHSWEPSYRDVMTASRNAMVAGSVIVAHDGGVWYISASTSIVADELRRLYNHMKNEVGDKAEFRALERLIGRARRVGLTWLKLR